MRRPSTDAASPMTGSIDDLWYKNAIVYCLDVDSFMDGNGDGHGDFAGLSRRLDYLAGLGINTVWLQPFYPTPNRDNGYDVMDFYNVDPRLGSLGDFVEFSHQAQQRGMRVIVDLVINHTSNRHPWFLESRKSKTSKKRDWYIWSKKRPANHDKGMVFPGVQDSTWTYDAQAREWYFHRFYEHQPDLNTAHPEVRAEIRRIMGFWLELGVSGFRVDALPFVLGAKGAGAKPNTDFEFLRELRQFLSWRARDAIILAEANVPPKEHEQFFGEHGDQVQMLFNFWVNQHLFLALADGDVRPLREALNATRLTQRAAQWGQFLRNHDELDLGRLSKKDRNRVFKEFAPEPRMQLYDRGIRRRLAPMLGNDRQKLELAYSLMFSLPGTPVLRYGDELGMGDDLRLKERIAARTPMQWSRARHGGFSTAEKTDIPVIEKGPYGARRTNAADQRRDPGSLLNWTERMIRVRKECPELGWGDWQVLPGDALVVRYDWRGRTMVVVHNLASQPCTAVIDLGDPKAELRSLLHDHVADVDKRGRHIIELEPHGYGWYRVGGFDAA
jgi:maltose alpha-D-glucosyltransferase / alpha-amylase